jgi:Zn-dependent metalloprotease
MKLKLLLLFSVLFCFSADAQIKKQLIVPSTGHTGKSQTKIILPGESNTNNSICEQGLNLTKVSWSSTKLSELRRGIKILSVDLQNTPNWFETKLDVTARSSESKFKFSDKIKANLEQSEPNIEFEVLSNHVDELGIKHFQLIETYKGIPIYGSEYNVHEYLDGKLLVSGNFKKPILENGNINVSSIDAEQIVISQLKKENISFFATSNLAKLGVQQNKLQYYFSQQKNLWYLIYEIKIMPNPSTNLTFLVDASTGEVIDQFSNICKIHTNCNHEHNTTVNPEGHESATALDLFGISRTINVWKEGATYFMLDGNRSMFSLTNSKLPDEPAGGILTLDAKNTAFNENDFRVSQVTSSNNQWSNATAVSAHYNGGKAYEYFKNVHSRNSIDGKGGSIISIINVRDENGAKMDNAFWNGEAMFYGNGDQAFTSLAKALDVAGHEMSHGVIQNTANLTYQGESGAINESFADIFGAMIDRDDWKMGEDVVVRTYFPSGALRDLSNPNNGGRSTDQYWQPKHVSEQYKGSQDNGGVHINSGITNHAFYLFVQELAKTRSEEASKTIAEKVYYRALTNYLSRSSQFKDLRIAVETSASDLHGNTDVLAAVKKAFDAVGIGGSGGSTGGTNYQKDLVTNPGKELILCTDQTQIGVYTFDPSNGAVVQLSSKKTISKPSVTDNGSHIFFVADDNKLYVLTLNRSTGVYAESVADSDPFYRNAIVSKDGKRIAGLSKTADNLIYVYDFGLQVFTEFKLYNPTYSQGVNAGNVQYADFMDFDHSGQYIMYDALSEITKSDGTKYEYWDIGFVNVFNSATNKYGDGKVEKLFSDLEENSSIGNPVFSKNSPYIITFDYYVESNTSASYAVLAANIETGDLGEIKSGRTQTGYPNYNLRDNTLLYDGADSNGENIYIIGATSSKIMGSGSETNLIREAKWGTWFGNGNRSLQVNTKEFDFINEMTCSPNPFTETIELQVQSTKSEKVNISIYDILGKLQYTTVLYLQEGKNSKTLSLQQLNSGNYQLVIHSEKGLSATRIIKN